MALEISGFSHVAIRVSDLKRAKRFYVELLGFPVALELEDKTLVKVGSGILAICGDAVETKPGDRFDPHRVGLDHVSFAVDSVEHLERMKRDLDAAGVPNDGVNYEPKLNATALVFYDPDGIALELYASQS